MTICSRKRTTIGYIRDDYDFKEVYSDIIRFEKRGWGSESDIPQWALDVACHYNVRTGSSVVVSWAYEYVAKKAMEIINKE